MGDTSSGMNFQSIFNAALTTIKGTIFNVQEKDEGEDDRAVKILSQADHTATDHTATGDTGEDTGDTGDDTSHSDTGDDTMDTGEDTGDTGEDTGDTGDDQPHKI